MLAIGISTYGWPIGAIHQHHVWLEPLFAVDGGYYANITAVEFHRAADR